MIAYLVVSGCVIGSGWAGWHFGYRRGWREGVPFGSDCRRILDRDYWSPILGDYV